MGWKTHSSSGSSTATTTISSGRSNSSDACQALQQALASCPRRSRTVEVHSVTWCRLHCLPADWRKRGVPCPCNAIPGDIHTLVSQQRSYTTPTVVSALHHQCWHHAICCSCHKSICPTSYAAFLRILPDGTSAIQQLFLLHALRPAACLLLPAGASCASAATWSAAKAAVMPSALRATLTSCCSTKAPRS